MTDKRDEHRRQDDQNANAAKNFSTNADGARVVRVTEAVRIILEIESSNKFPRETGGVLIGHQTTDAILVTYATGPGPNAIHGRSRFRRDGTFTQGEVDRLFAESEGREDYEGEWHSHPASIGPSPKDRASMEWISRNPEYVRPEPLLVIAQRTRWWGWRLLVFVWRDGLLAPAVVEITPNA